MMMVAGTTRGEVFGRVPNARGVELAAPALDDEVLGDHDPGDRRERDTQDDQEVRELREDAGRGEEGSDEPNTTVVVTRFRFLPNAVEMKLTRPSVEE